MIARKTVFNQARAYLFYAAAIAFTIGYAFLAVPLAWLLPFRYRYPLIIAWNRVILSLLSFCCGVRCDISGTENIPKQACVVVANHESTWEALYFQTLFNPLSTIVKRELLWIPFFGWGLAGLKPIAIERSSPRQAIRQTQDIGLQRVAANISVLVFPQGTRVAPDEQIAWARGAANLAIEAGVAVLPIAHNAGDHWHRDRLVKTPGRIQVRIGEAIVNDGLNSRQLTERCQQWVNSQRQDIAME